MTLETEADVVALKRIGRSVSQVLHEMLAAAHVRHEHTMIITKGAALVVTRH